MGSGFKFGICEWCLPISGPFSVRLASLAGYEGIQIGDLGGSDANFPLNNKAVQEGYLQACTEENVVIQAMHPNRLQRQGTMLCPPGTKGWDEAQLSLKKAVDACVDLNIPEMMVSSFFNTDIKTDSDFKSYIRHLNNICGYAEDKGVIISYETPFSLKKIQEIIDLTNGKLKICYDVMNPTIFSSGVPTDDIPVLGLHRISHFHFKDMVPGTENWCPMGEGSAGAAAAAETIKNLGYKGWIVCENDCGYLAKCADGDFLEYTRDDLRRLKKMFD